MAKIVQVLTRASREYDVTVAESQVRNLTDRDWETKHYVSTRIKR